MTLQSLDPTNIESGGPGRILVVYPTEESRKQSLSMIDAEGAIDRTLHHTIDSLKPSLAADLRLPRLLSKEGAFDLVLHEAGRRREDHVGGDGRDQDAVHLGRVDARLGEALGRGLGRHERGRLGLVLEDAKSLSTKLGREDKETLGEFMEMIRNIEIRIAKQKKMISSNSIETNKTNFG